MADINYTHYGHEKELEHVWIPKGKRQEIAAKGRYCIRESVNGTFSHHHLIDTTDLNDIETAFVLKHIQ